MTTFLEVETSDFVAAARTVSDQVADPVSRAAIALSEALGGSGAMAGDDPGARAWAASYDRAARSALQAHVDLANACNHIASLFGQSARNYAAAERASSARQHDAVELAHLPPDTTLYMNASPPPAAGGSGGGPPGWSLVADAVGYVWPDGHQDRLHAAGAAWQHSAQALSGAGCSILQASAHVSLDRLPEAADVTAVCSGMQHHLFELADVHAALGNACHDLAHHIDTAHASIISELEWMLGESAGIQVIGAALSFVTAGAAEGATQAVEAGRVAKAVARIRDLLATFRAAVAAVTVRVAAVVSRADHLAGELHGYAGLRYSVAAVNHVRGLPRVMRTREAIAMTRLAQDLKRLPEFAGDTRQLQAKYKHAADFGVVGNYSLVSRARYEGALRAFVNDPKTVRVWGTFHKQRVVLNYQVESRLVVVQWPDGRFVTGWRVPLASMRNVRVRRALGGG